MCCCSSVFLTAQCISCFPYSWTGIASGKLLMINFGRDFDHTAGGTPKKVRTLDSWVVASPQSGKEKTDEMGEGTSRDAGDEAMVQATGGESRRMLSSRPRSPRRRQSRRRSHSPSQRQR